ncbi:hypothetical protein AGOR_G00054010 [Albula goreensis]|uniref:FIP-RBD domain-containing protein n=1 Tax=Albula goreensis TaxID=1534307 RepID=A0A8T3DV76_9TELE|nr:hypothetical protein AGOR_G00054010 [Albula goreensis]
MFSNIHNSMAPPNARRSSTDVLGSSTENLSAVDSYSSSSDKKRRAPLPPSYQTTVKNANPPGAETPGTHSTQKKKAPSLPLPDYNTLFPKRIHGVQGQTRWDHIVAEVTQRQREYPPELTGEEMSVDAPSRRSEDLRGATYQDRFALSETKANGSSKQLGSEDELGYTFKRAGSGIKQAITPPKPTPVAPPRLTSNDGVKQGLSTRQASSTIEKPNLFASRVLGATSPKVQNSTVSQPKPQPFVRDEKKVLNTSVNVGGGRDAQPKERLWSPGNAGSYFNSAGGAQEKPDNQAKEVPVITPRQRSLNKGSAKVEQMERPTPVLRSGHGNKGPSTDIFGQTDSGTVSQLENSGLAITQKAAHEGEDTHVLVSKGTEIGTPEEVLKVKDGSLIMANEGELFPSEKKVVADPFPNEVILVKDPWTLPAQSLDEDDLFTGGSKIEKNPLELGMTTDDMEKLFESKDERDPFSYFDKSESEAKRPEQPKAEENPSEKQSSLFQRTSSAKKGRAPLPPVKPDKTKKLENLFEEERAPSQGREKQLATDPFSSTSTAITSSLTSPEPLKALAADGTPQTVGTFGGKIPLRAWVSPSEAQPISAQNSGGGTAVGKGSEPTSTPRRPHPVKPMSSLETQAPTNISLGRDVKSSVILENVPEKRKVTSSLESGPYSQLTQEELISMVVKQQDELSKKNNKIVELEEYIDNLLVRVIEEKPSILLSVGTCKKAF